MGSSHHAEVQTLLACRSPVMTTVIPLVVPPAAPHAPRIRLTYALARGALTLTPAGAQGVVTEVAVRSSVHTGTDATYIVGGAWTTTLGPSTSKKCSEPLLNARTDSIGSSA